MSATSIAAPIGCHASILQRLSALPVSVASESGDLLRCLGSRPCYGVASSHFGRSNLHLAQCCRALRITMRDTCHRGGVLVSVLGTAIDSWAALAASRFEMPLIRFRLADSGTVPGQLVPCQQGPLQFEVPVQTSLSADRLLFALSPRVDVLFRRSGGRIDQAMRWRLAVDQSAWLRVSESEPADGERDELINKHALPLPLRVNAPSHFVDPSRLCSTSCWCRQEDEWLIHCTRQRFGPWPNQSKVEFLLSLLASADLRQWTPQGVLERILSQGRLTASAVTSDRRFPVVCFSARSLSHLLAQRCYRSHVQRWDYEPYGVAIRKSAAIDLGIRPVIYGTRQTKASLPMDQRYRFQAIGKQTDWRSEQEWRSLQDVDLTQFHPDDIRVFSSAASR